MTISSGTLWTLGIGWLAAAAAITAVTGIAARRRLDSPGLLTICSALLAAFPPFNLLILAAVAMLPERRRPSAPDA
jgi:hypothetical protein